MKPQFCLFSITIIFLLLAILHANPALTAIAGLESNIITLTNSNQSDSQLYISSFASTFTTIPKIALAITGLSGSNSNIDSSFHITPQTITISSFIVSWQRNTQKWQRVDLKYMASTRDDLLLGTSQTTYNGESNKIKIDVNEIANFNASILRTFLLGCDTSSSSIKCGLLPSGVAQNSFSIEIENMAANSKISFSYVIFAPSIAKFTSYGGLVNKEAFKGSLNAKVFKTIAYTDHKFHGLSYLKLTGEIASNFNSKIDLEFAFNLYSEQLINSLSLFYVVIGRTAKNSCTDPNNALQLKTQCLSVCPDNSYIYSYSDGGKSCQSCSQVFNLTLSDGKCVLINKTTQVNPSKTSESLNNLIPLFKQAENKQIKTISQSSIPQDRSSQQVVQQAVASQSSSNQQQTTQQTYTNIVDSSASSYSSTSSSNTPIATSSVPIQQPQNQQSYTQTNDNSGIYVTQASATSSQVMINPQNIPNPTCGSSQFFLNGICVCQVGYQRVGGICIGFSSQSEQAAIQTKVIEKSSNINTPTFGNTASPTVFCGEGYDNGFGVCVCSNGMTYDQGRCYPIQPIQPIQQQQQLQYQPQNEIPKEEPTIQCGRNQKFDKEKYSCLCKRGYGRLNGACILCPDRMVINEYGFCVEDFREKKEEKKTQISQNDHKNKDDSSFVKVQPALQLNSSISLDKKQKDCENITVNATIPTQPQPQTPKQQKIPPPPKSDDNKNPSTLTKNTNITIKPSDDIKTPANLKLSGSMKGNNNQIFMTLDSITPFDFPDQQTMSSFLKAKFTGCSSPTLFCNQQVKTKNLFDCLLLFPSGVPNQSFTVEYSYSYQGNEGYTKIAVDPLKIQSSNSRSNSRVSSNIRAS